jgi:hypothetical protein
VYDPFGSSSTLDPLPYSRSIEDNLPSQWQTGQQDHQTTPLTRSQPVFLQQQLQDAIPIHAELGQRDQQRLRSDETPEWYPGDSSGALHEEHYRSGLGSSHTSAAVRYVGHGALVHPDASGIGPPSSTRSKSGSSVGIHSSPGWDGYGDNEGYESHRVDNSGDGFDDNAYSTRPENRDNCLFGSNDRLLSTHHRAESSRDGDREVEYSPSGLVGISQEIPRGSSFEIAPRRVQSTSQSQSHSRNQIHQQQLLYQQLFDYDQQRHAGSTPPTPVAPTTYHPNDHVLHSRHPMHRFSMAHTN